MSSASQWPPRPTGSDVSGSLRAGDAAARQAPQAIVRGYPDLPAVTAFCLEALDGALELVRADGGEVAALDVSGTLMVTRARRKRPPRIPGFGSPSRPSQPISSSGIFDIADPIDSQVTQLLPSAQLARTYTPEQGLIGAVWRRREPIQARLDASAMGAENALLVEADALHHLATPIFRPDTLNHLAGRGPVIGVLRVFNRDDLWPYSANDRLLLELHADRLGRALALLDTASDTLRRGDLVGALHELSGVGPTLRDLFTRVAEIATRQFSDTTFAALLKPTESDDLSIELALRSGAPLPNERVAIADLPPWMQRAVFGELTLEHNPQGGAPAALSSLGWSQEPEPRSALAAPLLAGGRPIGVLVVTSPQADAFNADAAALFEALALATATFAENARLVENARLSVGQLNEQRRQLSALNNAVQTLNSSLDVDATLQALAEQASLLTTAQICAVFLREEEAGALVCRAVYPPEREQQATLIGTRIPLEWRQIGQRLTETTFLSEEDLTLDQDAPDSATAKLARVGITSFLAAPIAHQERHLGALVV